MLPDEKEVLDLLDPIKIKAWLANKANNIQIGKRHSMLESPMSVYLKESLFAHDALFAVGYQFIEISFDDCRNVVLLDQSKYQWFREFMQNCDKIGGLYPDKLHKLMDDCTIDNAGIAEALRLDSFKSWIGNFQYDFNVVGYRWAAGRCPIARYLVHQFAPNHETFFSVGMGSVTYYHGYYDSSLPEGLSKLRVVSLPDWASRLVTVVDNSSLNPLVTKKEMLEFLKEI